jgi:toxin-antitoxin system PIN domain toxin
MLIPDANILLYATDKDSPDHKPALAWWQKTLSSGAEVGLCSVVAFAFVRIATNRNVFRNPLPVKDACSRVANWLEFPNVVWLDSISEDFAVAAKLLSSAGTGANLVTDAQIAAIALRTGGEICSCDQDFSRFKGIKWSDPLK